MSTGRFPSESGRTSPWPPAVESKAAIAQRFGLPADSPRPHRFYELSPAFVTVNGHSMAYVSHGSGPPLVLVHGLMTSAYSWRYVIDELGRDYRCIVPDLPGAGLSAKNPDRSYGGAAISRDLAGFLDALGLDKVLLVGNSLGGLYSTRFVTDNPGRVEKLAVMHSPGFMQAKVRAMQVGLAIPPARALFRRHLLRNGHAFVSRNVHYHRPMLSAEEVLEYGSLFETRNGADSFIGILRDCLAGGELLALHERLRATPLKLPVLLLWARHDALVSPSFGPRYQALIPGSQLVWMDDTSHFMHVDSPEETVEILRRFLQ